MIEVELPDGRVVEINTTDPAVAAQAAKKFLATSDAPKLDKYQQAAIEERDALKAKGIDTAAGLTRRLAQGATLNTADEILAGLSTPLEMIKRRTFNPREAYNYAKAQEDLSLEDSRKQSGPMGWLGTGAEILGGVGSGLGAARAGLTFARGLAPNVGLASRSAASAGDAAAFGNLAGAGEGNSLSERMGNAAIGTVAGGLLGGITPAALSLASGVVSPIVSNIRARANPVGYGNSQVARGVVESGMTPQQIADSVRGAAAEGQGVFTAADAMGNAGQRLLATAARGPGQGRTDVVNFLEARQAGQGRRIANTISEGFGSRMTPTQMRAAMEAERGAIADDAFGAVRADAGQVNVVPAINNLDRTIGTGPGQALQAPNDSIEGVLRPFRERLARVNPDDFDAVQRIRGDMADAAQNAMQTGYGNRARLIGQAMRQLDDAMEAASQGYRDANRGFAQASRNIDAVDQGRTAALRGRTEDTIPQFQALSPRGQQAFRTGYADPLIEQAQGGAIGVNKARPLTSDAFADEARVMAPGNDLMQRRISRENTMFQTRNSATGNSKTAENLADDAAMSVGPELIGQVLSGNWRGALRSALGAGQNFFTGNTPAVRQAVAEVLLSRGTNVSAAQFERMIDETVQRLLRVQQLARAFGRGAAGGAAVGGWDAQRPSGARSTALTR